MSYNSARTKAREVFGVDLPAFEVVKKLSKDARGYANIPRGVVKGGTGAPAQKLGRVAKQNQTEGAYGKLLNDIMRVNKDSKEFDELKLKLQTLNQAVQYSTIPQTRLSEIQRKSTTEIVGKKLEQPEVQPLALAKKLTEEDKKRLEAVEKREEESKKQARGRSLERQPPTEKPKPRARTEEPKRGVMTMSDLQRKEQQEKMARVRSFIGQQRDPRSSVKNSEQTELTQLAGREDRVYVDAGDSEAPPSQPPSVVAKLTVQGARDPEEKIQVEAEAETRKKTSSVFDDDVIYEAPAEVMVEPVPVRKSAIENQKLIVGEQPGTKDPRDEFEVLSGSGAVAPAGVSEGEGLDNQRSGIGNVVQPGAGQAVNELSSGSFQFQEGAGVIGGFPVQPGGQEPDADRILKVVFGDTIDLNKLHNKKTNPFILALEPVVRELDQIRRILGASSDPYMTALREQAIREDATQNYFNQIELFAGNDDADSYLPSGLDEEKEFNNSVSGTLAHDLRQEVFGFKAKDFFPEPTLFSQLFGNDNRQDKAEEDTNEILQQFSVQQEFFGSLISEVIPEFDGTGLEEENF